MLEYYFFGVNYPGFVSYLSNAKFSFDHIISCVQKVLLPEVRFIYILLVYAISIGVVGLAVPMSIQSLIGNIVYTGLYQPIIIVTIILFILLLFGAAMNLMQFYVTELYQRCFISRLSSSAMIEVLSADNSKLKNADPIGISNRFFDIFDIQKTIVPIIFDGFRSILELLIGLIVLSFYHPIFFMMNILIVLSIYAIWAFYYKKAIRASVLESESKYDMALCLQNVAGMSDEFSSYSGKKYAMKKFNALISNHINKHKKHFKIVFTQAGLLFSVYTISASLLFGIGGFLVTKFELGIGQLVASELIFMSILYNISKLGYHFEKFYHFAASCEEFCRFYDLQNDRSHIFDPNKLSISREHEYVLQMDVTAQRFGDKLYNINLDIKQNTVNLAYIQDSNIQSAMLDLIKQNIESKSGRILYFGEDISFIPKEDFQNNVAVIDNIKTFSASIYEFITRNAENINYREIANILNILCLDDKIEHLRQSVHSHITNDARDIFSESEILRLKLANILLRKPDLIIATQIFSIIEVEIQKKIIQYIKENTKSAFILISSFVNPGTIYDNLYILGKNGTESCESVEKFYKLMS